MRVYVIPLVLLTALLGGSCLVEERCNADEWQCDDGLCILAKGYCDGHPDCYDGSDEAYCGCDATEFDCGDGTCIDAAQTCDGTDDCADASDEAGCVCIPTGIYVCEDLTEIAVALVCDGTALDCPDGSDEDYCWVADCVSGGGFECENGVCWEASFRCNGVDNCGDCSDEQGCQ